MNIPPDVELTHVRTADAGSVDVLVRWQSSFGLVVIEVLRSEVFVNGQRVEPASKAAVGLEQGPM